jgi:hypothetical protein
MIILFYESLMDRMHDCIYVDAGGTPALPGGQFLMRHCAPGDACKFDALRIWFGIGIAIGIAIAIGLWSVSNCR